MAVSPDFIGIGAQKAGTTWLYLNFASHPQIWLPKEKELHYFDEKRRLGRHPLRAKLFGDDKQDARWRRQVQRQIKAQRKDFDLRDLTWNLRYFLRSPSDRWYRSLFRPGDGKVKGEITPDYSLLAPDEVAHVAELLPHAKIFFFMRNPIERAWSHASMELLRINEAPEENERKRAFRRHFRGRRSQLFTDYRRTLDTWSAHFPEEQIFVGFLEDVHHRPLQLLGRLYEFLGVDTPPRQPYARRVVHSGSITTMPTGMARLLAEIHGDLIDDLAARFGGHAGWWQHVARRLRDGYGGREIVYPFWETPLWREWLTTGVPAGAQTSEEPKPPPVVSGRLSELQVSRA